MSVPGCVLVFSPVMAVFAGIHGIVEIIPDRLLKRIPFGKIMLLVARVARNAVQAFRFMDVGLRAPLTASLLAVRAGVAEPAIFVRRFSDDLKMKIVKASYFVLGECDFSLLHFQTFGPVLREFHRCPTRSHGRAPPEKSRFQSGPTLLPLIALQMTDQTIGLTHTASVPGGSMVRVAGAERRIISVEDGVVARNFIAEFLRFLVVIEVSFTIIFAKSSSRVAGPTILDDGERGFVNIGGTLICFLGQLARIG